MSSFAIPGLMPLDSPKYATYVPPSELYSHCVQNSVWEGIDPIGPMVFTNDLGENVLPDYPAARFLMEFSPQMYPERECVVFDSEPDADGLTEIVDAASWAFRVPPQVLPLSVGYWDWQLRVVDTADQSTIIFKGTILITP